MNASPLSSAFTLVQISTVNAKIPVPENEISLFHRGDMATVVVAALGNRQFGGAVSEIGVMADPLSHTYSMKIRAR